MKKERKQVNDKRERKQNTEPCKTDGAVCFDDCVALLNLSGSRKAIPTSLIGRNCACANRGVRHSRARYRAPRSCDCHNKTRGGRSRNLIRATKRRIHRRSRSKSYRLRSWRSLNDKLATFKGTTVQNLGHDWEIVKRA